MSFSALDPVYEHLGGPVGRSAGYSRCARGDHRKTILRRSAPAGFLFTYCGSIPVELLAAWLDASSAEAGQFSSFALSIQNGTVYFLAAGQTYQRCATKLSEQALAQALAPICPTAPPLPLKAPTRHTTG